MSHSALAKACRCQICNGDNLTLDMPRAGYMRIRCSACRSAKSIQTNYRCTVVAHWNSEATSYDPPEAAAPVDQPIPFEVRGQEEIHESTHST